MVPRVALATLLLVACVHAPPPSPSPPHPPAGPVFPLDADAAFFDRVVAEKSIVLLGESLHGTDDFPRARLPLLQALHGRMGFDVLAVEGSMIDAWLAEDDLLRGGSVEDAARSAWLTLWDTEAMRAVLAYAHTHGMYLASMDIQPAMGGAPAKREILRRFIARIEEYSGIALGAEAMASELSPLRTCSGETPFTPVARLVAAILQAVSAVSARSGMHAATLALIPEMIRERMAQCAEAAGDEPFQAGRYWKRYKEARDRHQARNVISLRDHVSRSHRVVVWAHHSHAAYHAAGAQASVSIGGQLKERLPADVLSVGVFGGSGRYLKISDGPKSGSALTDVTTTDGLDALRGLAPGPFYVDLRSAAAELAFAHERHAYPLEGDPAPAVLADEFDGVVFVPEVHPMK